MVYIEYLFPQPIFQHSNKDEYKPWTMATSIPLKEIAIYQIIGKLEFNPSKPQYTYVLQRATIIRHLSPKRCFSPTPGIFTLLQKTLLISRLWHVRLTTASGIVCWDLSKTLWNEVTVTVSFLLLVGYETHLQYQIIPDCWLQFSKRVRRPSSASSSYPTRRSQ